HFLLGRLLGPERDRVGDELRVLLHQVLQAAFFEVLKLIILEVEDHLGTAAELARARVLGHREGAAGLGFPTVAFVVVVLGVHDNLLSNKVGGVETDAELADHGNVGARSERLHECLGTGSRNRTEVVDQISLGHTDAAVDDGQRVVRLVRDDVNEQLGLRLELGLIRQTLEANLIESIGGVTARARTQSSVSWSKRGKPTSRYLLLLLLENAREVGVEDASTRPCLRSRPFADTTDAHRARNVSHESNSPLERPLDRAHRSRRPKSVDSSAHAPVASSPRPSRSRASDALDALDALAYLINSRKKISLFE
ncbi:hypothetical protein BE221DRAFT_119690, partial [Ostreococcus tauri]